VGYRAGPVAPELDRRLGSLVLFLPLYLSQVPCEERMMIGEFGEAYRACMGRTGRIFPRLGRSNL
jgi:protein-S-isoprenylcysteine O-methyltransferase Ste14